MRKWDDFAVKEDHFNGHVICVLTEGGVKSLLSEKSNESFGSEDRDVWLPIRGEDIGIN